MKKALLLFAIGTLILGACQKDPKKDTPSKDSELTGEKVDVSGISKDVKKVFVLNEGGMGSNNATLDYLRVSDGNYITGVFKKMNPDIGAGLGDVANDIAVNGDEVWIVVNNSGIVEVISAKDETEIAALQIATPRNIAFDSQYAYVSSWAGAYATYTFDPVTQYSYVSDSNNPKGLVYRINLKTKKEEGSVEVGYQPEGLAISNGKLYVANSGGISSQLAPNYAYDNTVSVIDTKTFKVEKTITVVPNLSKVYADKSGHVYVTTLGNYYDVHSGLYMIKGDNASKVTDYVSISAVKDDTVYIVGTESEYDWSATSHTFKAYSVKNGTKTEISIPVSETGTPYGLAAIGDSTFLVADAGDYFNPGTVSCVNNGKTVWTVTAGVCPGHFAIY